MTRQRWEQVEQIFLAALELPAPERGSFIAVHCQGDDALRQEVESLLSAKTEAGAFLETPAMQVAARAFPPLHSQIVQGQMVGAYRVLSRLGSGGMGEVWRARDIRIDRDVAIKFCGEQFTHRFGGEARAIGALNHPNLCHLYDVGPNYLVMELVEGESPRGPLALDLALNYARQIADALDAAHEHGIVHLDLKPDNVKIRSDGTVKVLDFGVAKFLRSALPPGRAAAPAEISATQTSTVLGTAAYMSPEQLDGQDLDKRSDIWAFGVLLFEMLTGEQPYCGANLADIRTAVLTTEPDWQRVPREAQGLVRRCLEKDRKKRLRDIGDVAAFLDDQQAHSGRERAESWRRSGWIAAAALAAVAAGGLWISWRQSRPEDKAMVRLDVDLGADVSLSLAGGGDPILSPDGARIAYVSRGRVFTRRLDETATHELAAAQGGSSLFFSPDGQWIAFFGHGYLRKISVNGGEAIDICRSNAAFTGGSWGEDGSIIAALSAAGGLSRVSAGGGTPSAVTELNPHNKEVSHRLPQILPGGEAVVFTAHSSIAGFDDAEVDVISLRDWHRKTLVRGGTFGRYLPSGHLVYVSRGAVFAAPFDLKTLELRGKPVPVLEQVIYSPQFGTASIAFSQKGTLLYRKGELGTRLMTVRWLDGQGKTEPLFSKAAMYTDVRLSPDGGRLAVAIGEGPERGIWVYDPRRETTTRLTPSDGIFRSPLWTPDGRFIVCRSAGGISWMRSDGSGKPALLTKSEQLQIPGSFSPDGQRLAFMYVPVGSEGSNGTDLWTVPVESNGSEMKAGSPEPFLQTPFNEYHPQFSPDGRWLAYSSNESGSLQVYVRAFPETGEKWMISRSGGHHPVFSRGKSELLFLNESSQIIVARYAVKDRLFRPEEPRIWSAARLPDLGNNFRSFDLAPDGRHIAAMMVREDPAQLNTQNHIVFIQNFFDELRRRVPVSN